MYHFPEVWKQLALFKIFQNFFIEFFFKFSFFNNGGSHVWWQFSSSTIILKGITNISFQRSLEAIAPSDNFSGFINWILLLILSLCSTFSSGNHVGWSAGTSEIFFKWDTLTMIVTKFGSNWFSGFREEDFLKSLQTDDKWWQ